MKVLILSCSTGGGHNSCAKYVLEELKDNNIESDFYDFYDIVNKKGKDLSSKIYLMSLNNDGLLFKEAYKMAELYSKTGITSPIYLMNKTHKNKLYEFIKENHYDLVVTTHLFPALTLTAINEDKTLDKINFLMVATDYEPCPFIEEVKPDYFVMQKGLEIRFIDKGISINNLLTTGIPVFSKYLKSAKNIKIKYCKDEKLILIMLGSMGFGNITDVINDILTIKNIKVLVVCGSNKELYNKLKEINNSKLEVLGFTRNINDLIYSSDIVLSKPGGLSSTEIASFRKPLLHIYPIPGIETYNTEFFEENNMSIVCNDKEDIIKNINLLIKNSDVSDKLIINQNKIINKNSCYDLVQFIINKYKK